jgi:hypothetical protein
MNSGCDGPQKKTPENRGLKSGRSFAGSARPCRGVLRCSVFSNSETEIGKVAVAVGNLGVRHQQSVDGGHQSAKQRGGGPEADRNSLGHLVPLLRCSGSLRCFRRPNLGIPDTSNNSFVCIAAFYLLQCNIKVPRPRLPRPTPNKKGRRKPAAQTIQENTALPIRRRPFAADRARRNRESRPPDDR